MLSPQYIFLLCQAHASEGAVEGVSSLPAARATATAPGNADGRAEANAGVPREDANLNPHAPQGIVVHVPQAVSQGQPSDPAAAAGSSGNHKISRFGNLQLCYYPLLHDLPKAAQPDRRPSGQHQYTLDYVCRMSIVVLVRDRKFQVKCRDWPQVKSYSFDMDGGVGYAWAQAFSCVGKWQKEWRRWDQDQDAQQAQQEQGQPGQGQGQ